MFAAFDLADDSKEWLQVKQKFEETMSSHEIITITRIQNPLLWEKYALSKKHLEEKNGGTVNELFLFPGSRTNNPEDIYGGEDGFDMRCSAKGMWGNANYFAVNASYSDRYSHQVSSLNYSLSSNLHIPHIYSKSSFKNQRQIFLARVLAGDSYYSTSDHDLTKPPVKPGTKVKYDSVNGKTCDSTVYMTYDNTRAYPAYLITYC